MKKTLLLIVIFVSTLWNISFAAWIGPHPRTWWWFIVAVIIMVIIGIIAWCKDLAEKQKSQKNMDEFWNRCYGAQEPNLDIFRNMGLKDMPLKTEKQNYSVDKEQVIFWMATETRYSYNWFWFLGFIRINFKNQKKNLKKIIKEFDRNLIGWNKDDDEYWIVRTTPDRWTYSGMGVSYNKEELEESENQNDVIIEINIC